jgi:hypothetical protein
LCSNISHLCRAIPVEISADGVRRHRLRSWYPVPAARTNRMTPPVAALHRRLHPRMDRNRERRTARGHYFREPRCRQNSSEGRRRAKSVWGIRSSPSTNPAAIFVQPEGTRPCK